MALPSVRLLTKRALRRVRGVRRVPFLHHRRYRQWISGVPMDAMRSERILAFLLDDGWVGPRQVQRPRPASVENLQRVHGAAYLRSLEDPEAVSRVMGVPLAPDEARAAVELQRLMVGGTIQASRLAVRSRAPAIHLGGGFHHAAPDRGMGFCLMNDVAVAIARLRARGYHDPVLVVDLDLHDGNGTRAAFARDPSVHTFSLHNQAWDDDEAVASTSIEVGAGVDDDAYLEVLRRELPPVVASHRAGLVFYVAGVDPAGDDLYGDGRMSGPGILARDRFVVETVRRQRAGIPFVVTLAGGYGPSAWRHWTRFLVWLLSGREVEPPDDLSVALRRVRWLEETRTSGETGEGERRGSRASASGDRWEWRIAPEDLGALVPGAGEERRLLGRYGTEEIRAGLERFGILQQIRSRGYRGPEVELNPSTGFGPTVRVWGEPERRHLLVELRLRVDERSVPGMRLLFIEWLLLQDPRQSFPPGRSPLPGQEHPGMGALADVVAWLVTLCGETGLDGMGFRSSHFHMAVLSRRHLRFLLPEDEERFRTILREVRGRPLADASRAVDAGEVLDSRTGEPIHWPEVTMVVPVSDRLSRHLGPGDDDA